ncbi:hypothetical protein GCM10017083_04350 [Thalassobaculum fulvum]|uniref:Uncharacterized protein n=1 Tax=Thalassobaculum fulvum TaxID=1633335 RepID=A0A918XPH6_9PROT|nr:hypothetical protein GCM10017083_04350 [Thalassobaculum fulvum]
MAALRPSPRGFRLGRAEGGAPVRNDVREGERGVASPLLFVIPDRTAGGETEPEPMERRAPRSLGMHLISEGVT